MLAWVASLVRTGAISAMYGWRLSSALRLSKLYSLLESAETTSCAFETSGAMAFLSEVAMRGLSNGHYRAA
jgi:hypothetical protein